MGDEKGKEKEETDELTVGGLFTYFINFHLFPLPFQKEERGKKRKVNLEERGEAEGKRRKIKGGGGIRKASRILLPLLYLLPRCVEGKREKERREDERRKKGEKKKE